MHTANQPDVDYYSSESHKGFPFSEAVRVGNLLLLSGQIGVDHTQKLVLGGILEETRQTMENIKSTLAFEHRLTHHRSIPPEARK